MSRIKEWFTEFCLVLEATPRLEYSIAAVPVVPALFFAFGTWVLSTLDTTGPYGPMVAAMEGPLQIVFAALSAMLLLHMLSRASMQYRKARSRLYGY